MSVAPHSSDCDCAEPSTSSGSTIFPHCECPRDEHEIVIHEETCLLFKHEKIIFPHEPKECECESPTYEDGICKCCACPEDQCFCNRAGKEVFDEWRKSRDVGAMPAVLESTHPLMQKFQETLKRFLEKENAIAEEEIIKLTDELKMGKVSYDKELEGIYRNDHDTNAQRLLIEEYEATLANRTQERQEADDRARASGELYKQAKEKLEDDMNTEREAIEELEALTNLVKQLEKWRDETESGLTISHRMSDKMKLEKRALADEKRELDVVIFGLKNEIWKLESRLEMFQKQMEIKNKEMDIVNDKVTAYSAELEDLDLDKRRLVSLWNSVLVNIKQRDKVFDSVRDDYRNLQENYRTLVGNLEITKKITLDEMHKSKEQEMKKDKLNYDINLLTKQFEAEDAKRMRLETHILEITESIEMTERDQNMIKMENQTMRNILKTTESELDRRAEQKLKLENEILANLQGCLLNDKAVESMANGIKKMREMSTKLEISLMQMENQHAKMMLDIEVYRTRQAKNNKLLEASMEKERAREKELDALQEKYDDRAKLITRKQRELDITTKKYLALKEIFDMKSPQERRIEELEQQIKSLRERTETMQHEWLRLQGHVVKLTQQHHKLVTDMNLINKQIQICDQKTMHITANIEKVSQDRLKVERSLRDLRGQLEVLERTRKEANERNQYSQKSVAAISHEFTARLKDAESEIIDLEEEIETFDKEKVDLTQQLDRVQREALIWQRKGILAVELKRNIKGAKSAAGEIGQMKTEIHRMEVRREQLRRTSDKLAEDLAQYVTRRETAIEKTRASAAVEASHSVATGHTSQSTYHHKLRLARADVTRVTKELSEAKALLEELHKEQDRLETEVAQTTALNSQLEENVATLLRECRETERQKQWLLERVVRSQRLGSELGIAVRRQTLKVKKSPETIIAEYEKARALNDRIKYIVETLAKEYPHLGEKLEAITNTLNIYTPRGSPRLTEEAGECCRGDVAQTSSGDISQTSSENVAEKPLEDQETECGEYKCSR